MTPAGYMAKHVSSRPDRIKAPHVVGVFSVSSCVSENFTDYIPFWKHNGYWLFDSPEIIRSLATENSIKLQGTSLFYYEVYEVEFDGERWSPWSREVSFPTNVVVPRAKQLEGFDVVNFTGRTAPECVGLECSSLAEKLRTNSHALFDSFEEAQANVDKGAFNESEPGPYRIFSVYSLDWP